MRLGPPQVAQQRRDFCTPASLYAVSEHMTTSLSPDDTPCTHLHVEGPWREPREALFFTDSQYAVVALMWSGMVQRTPQAQRPAFKTPALPTFGRTPHAGAACFMGSLPLS